MQPPCFAPSCANGARAWTDLELVDFAVGKLVDLVVRALRDALLGSKGVDFCAASVSISPPNLQRDLSGRTLVRHLVFTALLQIGQEAAAAALAVVVVASA